MSILDINLADRQELKVLPDNEEVELRIARAEVTPNRNNPDKNNLMLLFDVPSDPLVDDIRVWLPIPTKEDKIENEKAYIKKSNRFLSFMDAFGIDSPLDTDLLPGQTGWVILSEGDGLNGEPQNSVRRYIVRR